MLCGSRIQPLIYLGVPPGPLGMCVCGFGTLLAPPWASKGPFGEHLVTHVGPEGAPKSSFWASNRHKRLQREVRGGVRERVRKRRGRWIPKGRILRGQSLENHAPVQAPRKFWKIDPLQKMSRNGNQTGVKMDPKMEPKDLLGLSGAAFVMIFGTFSGG